MLHQRPLAFLGLALCWDPVLSAYLSQCSSQKGLPKKATFEQLEYKYEKDHFAVTDDPEAWYVYKSESQVYVTQGVRFVIHVLINPSDSRYRLLVKAKAIDDPQLLFNLPQNDPKYMDAISKCYEVGSRIHAASSDTGCIAQVYQVGKMSLKDKGDGSIQIGVKKEPFFPHIHLVLRTIPGYYAFPDFPYEGPDMDADFSLAVDKKPWQHEIKYESEQPQGPLDPLLYEVTDAGDKGWKVKKYDPRLQSMRETLKPYFEPPETQPQQAICWLVKLFSSWLAC